MGSSPAREASHQQREPVQLVDDTASDRRPPRFAKAELAQFATVSAVGTGPKVTGTSYPFSSDVQVIDERHVVAVSLKSVIATEDGGGTWKTIFTGPSPNAGAIRLPQGYALPQDCKNFDNGTANGSATTWKVLCPQGSLSNHLRPSLRRKAGHAPGPRSGRRRASRSPSLTR